MAETTNEDDLLSRLSESLAEYDLDLNFIPEWYWESLESLGVDDPVGQKIAAVGGVSAFLVALSESLKAVAPEAAKAVVKHMPKAFAKHIVPSLAIHIIAAGQSANFEEAGIPLAVTYPASIGMNYHVANAFGVNQSPHLARLMQGTGQLMSSAGRGGANVVRVIATPTISGRAGHFAKGAVQTPGGIVNVVRGGANIGKGALGVLKHAGTGAVIVAAPAMAGDLLLDHVIIGQTDVLEDLTGMDEEWVQEKADEALDVQVGEYTIPAVDPIIPTYRAHKVVGQVEDRNIELDYHDRGIKEKTMFATNEVYGATKDKLEDWGVNEDIAEGAGLVTGITAGTVVLAGEVLTEVPAAIGSAAWDAASAVDDYAAKKVDAVMDSSWNPLNW